MKIHRIKKYNALMWTETDVVIANNKFNGQILCISFNGQIYLSETYALISMDKFNCQKLMH